MCCIKTGAPLRTELPWSLTCPSLAHHLRRVTAPHAAGAAALVAAAALAWRQLSNSRASSAAPQEYTGMIGLVRPAQVGWVWASQERPSTRCNVQTYRPSAQFATYSLATCPHTLATLPAQSSGAAVPDSFVASKCSSITLPHSREASAEQNRADRAGTANGCTDPRRSPALLQSMEAAVELDPEYKMALARTRQATAIHRAIGFLNTGSRARWVGSCQAAQAGQGKSAG